MKNLKESGDRFEIDLPADTMPGEVVIAGGLAGVAINGGKAGDRDVCLRHGAFELPKGTGAFAIGDKVGWDDVGRQVIAATGDNHIGFAFDNASAGDAFAMVVMKG